MRGAGRCWSDRILVLCKLENSLSTSRFGFSVSRRVGIAVERNRIKRQWREATRKQLHCVASGWDVVFIARRPIRYADYREIEASVAQLIRTAGLCVRESEAGGQMELSQ